MRHLLRAVLVTALGSMLLTGCSSDQQTHGEPVRGAATAAWGTDPVAAAGAGRVGSKGSPCALPVTFQVAKSWKPSSIPDGVATQGGFTLRCEVDAKPAGHLGFLRVWVNTSAITDPAAALEAFLAGQPGLGRQTRTTKAGTLPAAESTYLTENAELGVQRQERLLAVDTPTGSVVLSLGGVSLDEHQRLLPAYVLARQTITPLS